MSWDYYEYWRVFSTDPGDDIGADTDPWRESTAWEQTRQRMAEKVAMGKIIDHMKHENEERDMTISQTEKDRSVDAVLNRPATTTPSYADDRPTGAVPGLRPNPGMLRALLQPVLFLTLLEPVGAFEVGDVVAAQFWGEGRVMLTPLPAAASRGRIPTTFPANQIHAEITGPRDH